MPVKSRPILVADDDSDDRFFAQRSLQRAAPESEVHTYNDGAEMVEALTALAAEAAPILPRVVFLDIKMPRLDGFKTLRWIRAHQLFKKVPVVMLSGSAEVRDQQLARSLGADDYLVKNPSTADLLRVIREADQRN